MTKTKTKTRIPKDDDIAKVFIELNLGNLLNEPYNRDAQIRNLQKFSLYTDTNKYYASGDTRTDR